MELYDIITIDSIECLPVYSYKDPLPCIKYNPVVAKNGRVYNNNLICTFDIESTTISNVDKPYSFMYQWQMCIDTCVFFGRTWQQFCYLLKAMVNKYTYSNNSYIVIYVHFLSYEYQFIRDILNITEIFATKPHKILKCSISNVEFRCSYMLSNMALDKWTKQCGTKYRKTKTIFNYDKLRTPSTPLTAFEPTYCYIDVRGLRDCIVKKMTDENDTLASIPLTSTGYVRRHAKSYVLANRRNWPKFTECEIDSEQYDMAKLTIRGGNTSCNRYYIDCILHDLQAWDIGSSYPYQMYSKSYPTGKFAKQSLGIDIDYILNSADDYAYMISIIMTNVDLREDVPIPYISFSKCRVDGEYINCNGRITRAKEIIMCVTEIDLKIILSQYTFDTLTISLTYASKRSKLCPEYIDSMLHWYDLKCELKCKDTDPDYYYYMRAKNYLNSYFGMFITDIIHREIKDCVLEYLQGKRDKVWDDKLTKSIDTQLHRYYTSRNNFLAYQKGIWVTAHAREQLQCALDLVGMDAVYIDTDSIKNINDYSDVFNTINDSIMSDTYRYTNQRGETFYLGVWERDPDVKRFKSLGAKKYYCEYDEYNSITVSGLSKTLSINTIASIDDFNIGTLVDMDNSGRTTSYYNDTGIHYIYINGERILTASNIGVVKTTYTLGISDELSRVLDMLRRLDK